MKPATEAPSEAPSDLLLTPGKAGSSALVLQISKEFQKGISKSSYWNAAAMSTGQRQNEGRMFQI